MKETQREVEGLKTPLRDVEELDLKLNIKLAVSKINMKKFKIVSGRIPANEICQALTLQS